MVGMDMDQKETSQKQETPRLAEGSLSLPNDSITLYADEQHLPSYLPHSEGAKLNIYISHMFSVIGTVKCQK